MQRIKTIIKSFLEIGRDPAIEISNAWAAVASGKASQEQGVLIGRIIDDVIKEANRAKSAADERA